MANNYFTHTVNRVPEGSRARAAHVNDVADEIAAAFDKIPSQELLKGGQANYALDTGANNDYVVNLALAPSALTDGLQVIFKISADNTGPPTLNLNSLGAKALKNGDGSDIGAGDLVAGQIIDVRYNGSEYLIMSATAKIITTAKTSASLAAQSAKEAADSAALATGKFTTSEVCLGYVPVFDTGTTFHIAGLNVVNLFNVGRRLKFIEGSAIKNGLITASSFTTNTDITVQMDSGQVLTNALSEVCFVTGVSGWSPILSSNNPLFGQPINDILSGVINNVEIWVAVGDYGKIITSSDRGITWIERVSGTTKNLLCIGYSASSSSLEQFMIGASAGLILSSYDGINWGVSQAPLSVAGTGDVHAIFYGNPAADGWHALVGEATTSGLFYRSLNEGASWSSYENQIDSVANPQAAAYSLGEDYMAAAGDSLIAGGSREYLNVITITIPDAILAIEYIEPSYGAVLGTGLGGLFYTLDPQGNGPWVDSGSTVFGTDNVNSIAVSRYLHPLIVAVANNAKIAISTDGGANWTSVQNGNLPNSHINAVHYSERDLLFISVSSAGEICRSTNGIN